MRIASVGTLPCIAGGLFGWRLARVMSAAAGMESDPAHYRVQSALDRLSSLPSSGPLPWIVTGFLAGLAAWVIVDRLLRGQGRRAGWRVAALVSLPLVVGLSLLPGDLLSPVGRFKAVAAVGVAGAGGVVVLSLITLWPIWRHEAWQPRVRTVWAASAAVSIILGLWMVMVQEPTGDEPSYLLVMHSLVYDHDLDVENNHARQDYRFFYPAAITHGQMLTTLRGVTLPKHSLGLPLVGAVAYAGMGRLGVSILCSAIVGAFAASIFHYVRLRLDDTVAIRCWSVVLLCTPLVLYAGQIYPNAAAGLLITVALLWAQSHPASAGVALGMVPWFHLGTWPLAVGALAVTVLPTRRVRPALIVPVILVWGGLVAFHWHYWRRLLPPSGPFGRFSLATIPEGIPGLFLDQESGLLWVAPIWLGLMLAPLLPARELSSRREGLLLGAWLLYISSFNWWYGGWSPIGRFLLPALAFMALQLGTSGDLLRVVGRWLWLVSGTATTVLVSFPFFRFNAHDGTNAVLDAAGPLGQAAAAFLPSVVHPRPAVWAAWCVSLTAATLYAWRRVRHSC